MKVNLERVARIAAADHHLAVVATTRSDGAIQSSVVNAGLLDDPVNSDTVVAFVTYGRVKLCNLRSRPVVTLVFRAGWQWVAVEGRAKIAGPDDLLEGFDRSRLPQLLRDVFTAAGGTHDDWQAYDAVMARERRAAVLVTPERVYGNFNL